jgi:hypothetical protein
MVRLPLLRARSVQPRSAGSSFARLLTSDRQAVRWTPHAKGTTSHHVRVNHRRADILVPQQLLHRADVRPALEGASQSCGEIHDTKPASRCLPALPPPRQPSAPPTRAADTGSAAPTADPGRYEPPRTQTATATRRPRSGTSVPAHPAESPARNRPPDRVGADAGHRPSAQVCWQSWHSGLTPSRQRGLRSIGKIGGDVPT